ncbi:2-oxoacid ferredoxin oxidoreductase [candidate division WOR-1 bacterium RIFOXYA12_FULL_43_27]|uniref:2-oxoacid ferredoxin oxidoreductase n=1 Tax=candidate division WOR-1 bacterium RIFOXYC2_FULL_46_14 TaxID=1802587 RepID=A0A1F4U6I4_UNCSA|nr:MAG: 2-oxoacid ferredoxin oxidoreductase [candidate division WOR-1 bacterium RIFOXYA12_FULL_43_27]OGC19500.1 MAG: 2-oxoacid ferredoxin oxidoreductase [candidate division WOR-1 bacterium RIFOXYB2_FULL_46_45]OGC30488.1 MAG: 2-oxoacid ferredoxin oxidoreductase [candidate division WOR-1 bacterium RIFOXYA2_FULL_46_56]OGC40556.1 MAG: 2-oxoacid ferredoxin oxidoreductase [candidate division WOR-1 bacterium RIFOXYC2_FULL_46_14]
MPKKFGTADPIAWCPGCGNFGILNSIQKALSKLGGEPKDYLLVSGIGQSSKLPHYINANCFNGLHGRALPAAAAAKMVNRELTVLVHTGDGDCYGEGGNHFLHNIRRNIDLTVIVHNNQIYGLTKGQASPTTDRGYKTKVQINGVILEPMNALGMALSLGAPFVARGFSDQIEHLTDLIVRGAQHKGFALIEVLQPCVTFNKKNTHKWYQERVYKLEEDKSHNPSDLFEAWKKTFEWGEKIPIGVFFEKQKPSYGEASGLDGKPPLFLDKIEDISIGEVFDSFIVR